LVPFSSVASSALDRTLSLILTFFLLVLDGPSFRLPSTTLTAPSTSEPSRPSPPSPPRVRLSRPLRVFRPRPVLSLPSLDSPSLEPLPVVTDTRCLLTTRTGLTATVRSHLLAFVFSSFSAETDAELPSSSLFSFSLPLLNSPPLQRTTTAKPPPGSSSSGLDPTPPSLLPPPPLPPPSGRPPTSLLRPSSRPVLTVTSPRATTTSRPARSEATIRRLPSSEARRAVLVRARLTSTEAFTRSWEDQALNLRLSRYVFDPYMFNRRLLF
jgi:hypothetical protein